MVQFLSRLFPQRSERPLYDLFAELAELLVQASDTHSKVLGHGYRERTRIAPRLHEQSTVAEELCRRIAQRLAQSLITPYEAELLYDFALTIADTVDAMEHTAELLVASRLGNCPPRCWMPPRGSSAPPSSRWPRAGSWPGSGNWAITTNSSASSRRAG